ncbi:NAD(P)H-dependent flavin oxidoreductase [Halovenus sp. HT40]|uniref:NAD(P)H-dependent flavin oxidoreductase n=1 Tax=Halovenus sp. HT40 TaxID=3126691 RepID=UPI00300EB2D1
MNTHLCQTLGIEQPVVQAPIGSATCPELAAAVSEAGGLGHLSITWRSPDAVAEVVSETRDRTANPFAVNLVVDADAQAYDPDELLTAALDAGAPVVSFSFGEPDDWIERAHDAGAQVIITVGSAAEAASAADAGADVICTQGSESGGHLQSDVTTAALVPAVADEVDVPIVAAGGISDGRGLAAALALGADGVWLGTRFLATPEANIAAVYRERVLEAAATDTVRTELFDVGWPDQPHCVLRNDTVNAWETAGRPESGDRPGEGETVGAYPWGTEIQRYGDDLPVDGATGDLEAMALYAGQSVGTISDLQPAGEVVTTVVEEAETTIDHLGRLATDSV